MTPPPLDSWAFHARRARRWSFIGACFSTLVVIISLPGDTPRFALAVYSFACGAGWLNVMVQHRALRGALSRSPSRLQSYR